MEQANASKIYGADELRGWLIKQGFRCAPDSLKYRDNECNWYAYRRSELAARRCECNSEDAGMQIVVKPSMLWLGDNKHESVEIELCGEAAGVWWKLSAYGLKLNEVPERMADIEVSLVAAWNSLLPKEL